MPPIYPIPTSAQLRELEQDLVPAERGDDPIFGVFPSENREEFELIWEQELNDGGIMNVRGLGGRPGRINKLGFKRFIAEPGVYGDFDMLDEATLTKRRQLATWGKPISIDDLVGKSMRRLVARRVTRERVTCWSLALTGSFQSLNKDGLVLDSGSFTPQVYNAAVAWSDFVNSTPYADLQAIQLLARGHSVSFGTDATLYINRKKANQLMQNRNPNDLGGLRLNGRTEVNSLPAINEILLGAGLPKIAVFDGNWYDESVTTLTQLIPDNKGLLVGRRTTGAPIGSWFYTMNINNEGSAPGTYSKVIDRSDEQVPREIEVHHGFNGGPVVYFGNAMITLNI